MGRDSRFRGRQAELDAISEWVAEAPEHAVLTLQGPPGVGKSRLATEWVARHVDATWIDLEAVSDLPGLCGEICTALKIPPISSDDPVGALLPALSAQILVLDPFDHLVPLARDAVDRWRRESTVRLIVVSALPLQLEGERRLTLPPLAPEAAKALFLDRLAQLSISYSDDDIEAVEKIVDKLDGLPLALALTAARVRLTSLKDLADELSENLALLRARDPGLSPRHSSLRAAVMWSIDRLAADTRQALLRLSVFPDSFDQEAANAILSTASGAKFDPDEALETLLDSCFMATVPCEGRRRFRLYRPIRAVAWDQLPPEAKRKAERAHAALYAERFQASAADEPPAHIGDPCFAMEVPNLHAGATTMAPDHPETSLRLCLALFYWYWGRLPAIERNDSVRTFVSAFEKATSSVRVDTELGLHARERLACVWTRLGRETEARELLRSVIAETEARQELSSIHSAALNSLGVLEWGLDNVDAARLAWRRATRDGATRSSAAAAMNLALLFMEGGDPEAALAQIEAAPPLRAEDPIASTYRLTLGGLYSLVGRVTEAQACLNTVIECGAPKLEVAVAQIHLGLLALARDDRFAAKRAFAAARVASETLPAMAACADALDAIAFLAAGDTSSAMRCWNQSLSGRPVPLPRATPDYARSLLSVADARLERTLGHQPGLLTETVTRPLLVGRHLAKVLAKDSIRDSVTICVDLRGRWFRRQDARLVELRSRTLLARLVAALAEARQRDPGKPLGVDELIDLGWPGQSIRPDAAAARLHQAIFRLRTMGLGDAVRSGDGYFLDPDRCRVVDDPSPR